MGRLEPGSFVFRVQKGMNTHGVLSLTTRSVERVYQVVAYDDESVRTELTKASAGRVVHVKLHRIPGRASVYRATSVANVDADQSEDLSSREVPQKNLNRLNGPMDKPAVAEQKGLSTDVIPVPGPDERQDDDNA